MGVCADKHRNECTVPEHARAQWASDAQSFANDANIHSSEANGPAADRALSHDEGQRLKGEDLKVIAQGAQGNAPTLLTSELMRRGILVVWCTSLRYLKCD